MTSRFYGNKRDIEANAFQTFYVVTTIKILKVKDGLVKLGFNAEKMSATAQYVSGYGQGTDTTAVLTNRSKYITIIGDKPSRHSRTFPSARHRKGTRPMHTTTLTYEVKPVQTSYVSCMKAVSK